MVSLDHGSWRHPRRIGCHCGSDGTREQNAILGGGPSSELYREIIGDILYPLM
jgi:hypothetical protein